MALLLTLVLAVSFLIRLDLFYKTSYFDESYRDYLVADHIVKYHEFPMFGPLDEGYSFLENSPAYHYVLAFFLFIKNSFIFLGVVNIILQLINGVIIFFLSKKLFNTATAFLSTFIVLCGSYFLKQSNYIWQPYVMQPFINLSYLLLILGYKKKNYNFLATSVFIFLVAGAVHRSALAQAPILIFLIGFIIKSWKADLKKYLFLISTGLITLIALYFPVILSHLFSVSPKIHSLSPGARSLALGFKNNWDLLWANLFIIYPSYLGALFLASILLAADWYYFLYIGEIKQKIYQLVLLWAVAWQFILSSYFADPQMRYFTPILSLLIILISSIIVNFGHGGILKNFLACVLALFFISFSCQNVYSKLTVAIKNTGETLGEISPVTAVEKKIVEIKNSDNIPNNNFFLFTTYRNGSVYSEGRIEAIFLVALEQSVAFKFAKVQGRGYVQTNEGMYYFIICYQYKNLADINKNCLNQFLNDNKSYILQSLVYEDGGWNDFYVYLAKKKP